MFFYGEIRKGSQNYQQNLSLNNFSKHQKMSVVAQSNWELVVWVMMMLCRLIRVYSLSYEMCRVDIHVHRAVDKTLL